MVNYNNSTIYKLCCNDLSVTDIYVGSTTNFKMRKHDHKSRYNNELGKCYNLVVYTCIRKNGGWSNWDMIEIEKYEASDKHDLHKRERHWMESLKSSLNKTIPTRTGKEHYEANKETLLENKRAYYKKNKEALLEKNKAYYEKNKEYLTEYHRKYKRAYYEKNKEALKEKRKAYYKRVNTLSTGDARVKQFLKDDK